MSISAVANRIYQRKRITDEDVQEMAPDLLLVRGCKPPTKSAGGLFSEPNNADEATKSDHPVRACAAFEVVLLPSERNQSRGNPLALERGDIVMCRNALVDPLPGNELATCDLYLGVAGVLERAPRKEGA